jgi:hypothetical protein
MRVHPPAADGLPGDLGRVVDSADTSGAPLRAVVLGRASAHPGAIVPARPLALAGPDDAERWLIVAPALDPGRDLDGSTHEIPEVVRRRLEAFLGDEATRWLDTDQAETVARQSVERGRRSKAADRAERAAADVAWTPTPGTQRRWTTFEGETHTQAELDLFRIPYRFQLYLREVLLPRERLLARIHRPPLAVGRWPFRRRTEHEAIVLLTDQQLLLLTDARAPDASIPLGGFIARATAVERTARARLETADDHTLLAVTLESARGPAVWRILLPPGTAVQELVDRVARFGWGDGAPLPARPGRVEPVTPDTTGWDAFFPSDAEHVWTERLGRALEPDEPLLAWALAPPSPPDHRHTTAAALTSTRLVTLADDGRLEAWPMGAVTTMELRSSPFASGLRAWTDRDAAALVLPFPFTVVPAFLDLFLATRRRLAAGPRA